jgi:hypothetical protein
MEYLIIRAITKNEKVKDRYTIYYTDGSYFSVDEHEVSRRKNLKLTDQVRLLRALNQGSFLDVNEKMINFFDLPSSVQSEVIISTRKAEK